jgi:hypothetical protein
LKTGQVGCPRCGETGAIPSLAPPPPEAPNLGLIKGLEDSLRSAMKLLKDADDLARKALMDFEKNAERLEKLDASLKPLGNLSKSRAASGDVLEPKSALEKRQEAILAACQKVKELEEQSSRHQKDIREIQMNLEIGDPESPQANPKVAESHLNFAREYEREVGDLDWQIRIQGKELARLESATKTLLMSQKEEAARLATAKQAREEIVKAYSKVQAIIQTLDFAAVFPEFKCQLSETPSRSPAELRIEISYMDDAAKDAEDENDIVPDEKYLKLVPGMIEAVFNKCGEVNSIKLTILANHLSKTGITRPCQVQKFTFENSTTWKELMAGAYKDDWQKILALCGPVPPYPREASKVLSNEALFIILVVALVASMVIFLMARIQILRR